MDFDKISQRIASRMVKADEPHDLRDDIDGVIGKFVTEMFGVEDATTEFFDAVRGRVDVKLEEEGLELDLDDTDVYPHIRQSVVEVVDEMDLADKD